MQHKMVGGVTGKTSLPRLPAVINRDRLFGRLDECLRRPATWISAPGGSGKTTLALSYLGARDQRGLWYQFDARDTDIATFYHVLGEAVREAKLGAYEHLPHLTRECLTAIDTFSHRFFDTMHADPAQEVLLVFDNCDSLNEDGVFFRTVADVIPAFPPNFRVMFLSREEPPPAFAKLRVNQHLAMVHWEDLKFTLDECLEVAALKGARESVDRRIIERIHQRTQGWIAGMISMFEHPNIALSAERRLLKNNQVIFDYFSGEIFDRQPDDVKNLLLRTAYLDRVDAKVAETVAAEPRAAELLLAMARSNYFTTQLDDDLFEYHPLFRDFLRHRVCTSFDPESLRRLQLETAKQLTAAGDVENAIELFREAEDWASLVPVLLDAMPELIRQGRYKTAENWLQLLPADIREANPWLLFWQATSMLPFDRIGARGLFEQAYQAFKSNNDSEGAYHTWAAAMETFFYMWMDLKPLDYWLREFDYLRRTHPRFPSLTIETRVAFCMFSALMWRSPDHPDLDGWREHTERMLDRAELPADLRVAIAHTLFFYYAWFRGDLIKSRVMLGRVEALLEVAGRNPLNRLMFIAMDASLAWIVSDCDRCVALADEGLAYAEQTGIHLLDYLYLVVGAGGHLIAGRDDAMQPYLERLIHFSHVNAWHYHSLTARAYLQQGNLPAARKHAEISLQKIADTSMNEGFSHLVLAQVHIAEREYAKAESMLEETRAWVDKTGSLYLKAQYLLCRTLLLLAEGNPKEASTTLSKALRIARQAGFKGFGWRHEDVVALYVFALENRIETDYVKAVIRDLRLRPGRHAERLADWPWPLSVRALGRFQLERAGGKGKQIRGKPLELLQVLIAHGCRDVPAARVTDVLWPDADGDAAHRVLDTTLYRLRRLIGDDNIVRLRNGAVSLDTKSCWVDALAVESLLRRIGRALAEGASPDAPGELFARLKAIYRGPFLVNSDAPWAVHYRETLSVRVARGVAGIGEHEMRREQWELAADCYAFCIEADPVDEALYQQLMRCYAELNQASRALSVYRRCVQSMRQELQMEPSRQIRSLAESLRE